MNINKDVNYSIDFWSHISNREEKEKLAKKICEKIKDGNVIGFGSGTTSFITACEIADKIKKENIKITAIPT